MINVIWVGLRGRKGRRGRRVQLLLHRSLHLLVRSKLWCGCVLGVSKPCRGKHGSLRTTVRATVAVHENLTFWADGLGLATVE